MSGVLEYGEEEGGEEEGGEERNFFPFIHYHYIFIYIYFKINNYFLIYF